MITSKIIEIGKGNLDRLSRRVQGKFDIFVGLPNNGQRYPYRAYEYGPQRLKGSKRQSRKAPTNISVSSKPLPLVAEVGFWNEFGTEDGRIPARPFLRGTIVRNKARYLKIMREISIKVLRGELDLEKGLKKLALVGQNDVRNGIKNWHTPPNAPSTIRQKGVNAPLKYKGTLVQSIVGFVRRK